MHILLKTNEIKVPMNEIECIHNRSSYSRVYVSQSSYYTKVHSYIKLLFHSRHLTPIARAQCSLAPSSSSCSEKFRNRVSCFLCRSAIWADARVSDTPAVFSGVYDATGHVSFCGESSAKFAENAGTIDDARRLAVFFL